MSTLSDLQPGSEAESENRRVGVATGLPGARSPRIPAGRASRQQYYEFRPHNVGRWIVWGGFAVLLAIAPLIFTTSLAHTMLSQMGIAIIVCLSYNMLLGQGGMLSFGHAVYSGMGSFLAIHTLNLVSKGAMPIP